MVKLSILLLMAAITNIIATNRTRRFLHADKCDIKTHPSIVSITNMLNDTNGTKYDFGTGNLITMKWVLTYSREIYFGNYANWIVVAGINYEIPGEADEFRKIKQAVIHKQYGSDLVLYELERPFPQNDRIQPAKLPATSLAAQGCETLTVVGWGTRFEEDFLRKTYLKDTAALGDLLNCGKAKEASCVLEKHSSEPKNYTFCYDMKGTALQCFTDHGLGVFCKDILVGVTSGLDRLTDKYCRPTGGEAFDIIYYMSWLQDITDIDLPTTPGNAIASENYKSSTPSYKRHTTAKYKQQFTSPSTSEETSEISYGQHIKPNYSIYLLLICLLLFL